MHTHISIYVCINICTYVYIQAFDKSIRLIKKLNTYESKHINEQIVDNNQIYSHMIDMKTDIYDILHVYKQLRTNL